MIAHLDLDAFYAAVEQRDRPELRGRPLVVGGDPHGRGVVATASYEARQWGIRSAMSSAEALRRCPEAVFVRPDMERYGAVSREVWDVVRARIARVERIGIDEGYLDLSHADADDARVRRELAALQGEVTAQTGLTCSLGCGTSKTVAKIASDRQKPHGLVIVAAGSEAAFLGPLAVRLLPGVGPRAEGRLAAAGVHTIGDLAALSDPVLARLVPGRVGLELRRRALGDDPRGVVTEPAEPVSISYEDTFDRDLVERDELAAELSRLAARLWERLERHGYVPCTVTLKVRYRDFAIATRSHTAPAPLADAAGLERLGLMLLDRALLDRPEPVRLLGLAGARLVREPQLTLPIGDCA